MKFNLSKFNAKSTATDVITGVSDIEFGTSIRNVLVEVYPTKVTSGIEFDSSATGIVEVFGVAEEATIDISSVASGTAVIFSEPGTADIVFDSSAVGSLLGEEYLELLGVTLLPGQELEINTCDLTVTIAGENAMHLLTSEGDFFDLLPGNNDIEVSATGANQVSVDAYWKDRWL